MTEDQLQQILEQRAASYNAGLTLRRKPEDRWEAIICMHFDPTDRAAGKIGVPLRSAVGTSRFEALRELTRTFQRPPISSSRDRR